MDALAEAELVHHVRLERHATPRANHAVTDNL